MRSFHRHLIKDLLGLLLAASSAFADDFAPGSSLDALRARISTKPSEDSTAPQDDPAVHQDNPVHQDDPIVPPDDPAVRLDDPALHQDEPVVHQDDPVVPLNDPAVHQGDSPSLDSWLENSKSKGGRFPRQIVFVRMLADKPGEDLHFLTIDVSSFNKLSYLKIANGSNANWDYKLNKAKYAAMDPLAAVLDLTKVDSVILAPEKGNWQLLRFEAGKRKVVFSRKAPSAETSDELVNWLFEGLGWDGVVLEQKGDFLLVGSMSKTVAKPQIQALAVSNSKDKIALKRAERTGAGLLSLSEAKDGRSIFDIVFLGQGVTDLPRGTKLVIEKKQKKD